MSDSKDSKPLLSTLNVLIAAAATIFAAYLGYLTKTEEVKKTEKDAIGNYQELSNRLQALELENQTLRQEKQILKQNDSEPLKSDNQVLRRENRSMGQNNPKPNEPNPVRFESQNQEKLPENNEVKVDLAADKSKEKSNSYLAAESHKAIAPKYRDYFLPFNSGNTVMVDGKNWVSLVDQLDMKNPRFNVSGYPRNMENGSSQPVRTDSNQDCKLVYMGIENSSFWFRLVCD